MIAALAVLAVLPPVSDIVAADGPFETPQPLTAGGDAFDSLLYPTPVLFDVDGDGRRELVVGDLFGHLRSCEPRSAGTSWAAPTHFTVAGGKELRLNNW